MKILVITVGGSCAPIKKSIEENKPDKIVFICSDDSPTSQGSYRTVIGKGKVCGPNPREPTEPNILTQVGISPEEEGTKFIIKKITAVDDLNACYKLCHDVLKELTAKHPDAQIIIDYTGGTKSMSVGLVTASLWFQQTTLSIVTGTRRDLVKVMNKTEHVRELRIPRLLIQQQLALAKILIEKFNFAACLEVLENTLRIPSLPSSLMNPLEALKLACQGFKAWDEFDHVSAWQFLAPLRKYLYQPYLFFLEAVLHSRVKYDETFTLPSELDGFKERIRACGYELVVDLMLNAERRAFQGHFDDAVGRLYRALEVIIQARLRFEYEINTSDVDVEKIPRELHSEYQAKRGTDKKVKIGLLQSYELLLKLNPEDPLAKAFMPLQNKIIDVITMRNHSIYAHGFKTVTKGQQERFHDIVSELFEDFKKNARIKCSRCDAATQFNLMELFRKIIP